MVLGVLAWVPRATDAELFVKGCRELNYCNGHGMCVSRGIGAPATSCQCFDGWGSKNDIAASSVPDCSKRICPRGAGKFSALVAASFISIQYN